MHYDATMRTTVDLPPEVHASAKRLADRLHQSLSSTLAEVVALGLARLEEPVISTDPASGLPVISLGRPVTADEVANVLDEE